MRILVSGANGFIGRALCGHLLSSGYGVLPAVRRPCGMVGENVVVDAGSWTRSLKDCETVIHLAGGISGSNDRVRGSLQPYFTNNVDSTLTLAYLAAEAGVRRFVFMSTIKVNGEKTAPGRCFKPNDPPAPQDSYAVSKLETERGLLEIAQKTGLDIVIIRPPLVYGPRVKGNFASLIRLVRRGVPMPFACVNNRRSMIALDNLINYTTLCADVDASPNAKGQVFLVSDGDDVSTPELLQRVAKAYCCPTRLFSLPIGFIQGSARLMGKANLADRILGSLVIDNSKTREFLSWNPPVSMEEQLSKMSLYDSMF
jgi:nucleoside-diphosphate-sugar epimerase